MCKQEGLGIKFEYSGPKTPQRNGRVERKFQTLFGRVRSMLNGAGLKDEVRTGIWAECASTATHYSNILVTRGSSASPYELLYKKKPSCINELRTFGEMGVVADRKKIQGKLEDRGKVCMFVGYPSNHACDVYKMFNLQTMRVFKSRDIIWLKKSYGDWGKKVQFAEEDPSDEEELEQEGRKLQMSTRRLMMRRQLPILR